MADTDILIQIQNQGGAAVILKETKGYCFSRYKFKMRSVLFI